MPGYVETCGTFAVAEHAAARMVARLNLEANGLGLQPGDFTRC
eukprot:CAMPEP_0202036960 /NCGR_PEP_ID=MMETSP0962-20130828/1878_1 /ASSEMBLY_ACC=CAM_ASM_000488 /TAXON_ID=4773 /ORGANISM="Schizochytrium aggregatum, Strain ATCC28209" /LENGTH=42 /DNA_ID= /DNA_START= /DNA_END= /DNA_ORIENTATION=